MSVCRWCGSPAPPDQLCGRCLVTVAGAREQVAAQAREVLARVDSGLLSRLISVFDPDIRDLRRMVAQADEIDQRQQARRRKWDRNAARGRP